MGNNSKHIQAPDVINLISGVFIWNLLRTVFIINVEIADVEVSFVRESWLLCEPISVLVDVEDTRNAYNNDRKTYNY